LVSIQDDMKEEDFDRYKMLKGERSTVDTLRESIARVMARSASPRS